MKRVAGVWIDHRRAVIVTVTGDDVNTKQIQSTLDKQVWIYSGSSQDRSSEERHDRQSTHHRNSFYDEVIAVIQDEESILIIGPGEAKNEFAKRLERGEISGRIVSIETVAHMSDLANRVQQQFRIQKNTLLPIVG